MATKPTSAVIEIKAPNFKRAEFIVEGTAPLVINKFSQKAREQIIATQSAGSTAKKGAKREPKDFDDAYEQAKHVSEDGWLGFNGSAIRNAMISACRVVGFQMTRAKLSVFAVADGLDADELSPLIRIYGTPKKHLGYVRNETGVIDIRARPMWKEWHAKICVEWDADMFTVSDVTNLLQRAGRQVGIGEGRPDSKSSAGQGWGTFRILDEAEAKKVRPKLK